MAKFEMPGQEGQGPEERVEPGLWFSAGGSLSRLHIIITGQISKKYDGDTYHEFLL